MALRNLPAVDALADELTGDGIPRVLAVESARRAVAVARDRIRSGEDVDAAEVARDELAALRSARPRRLINATGVLLHTNLGRAPLDPESAALAASVDLVLSIRNLFDEEYGHVDPRVTTSQGTPFITSYHPQPRRSLWVGLRFAR